MKKKKFYVLNWDFNGDKIEHYDVLPYFRERYKYKVKNSKKYPNEAYWKVPKTLDEFKTFVENESHYQFWSRCEYEMIIHGWPVKKNDYKIDIHEQVMMNLDTIAEILFNELN